MKKITTLFLFFVSFYAFSQEKSTFKVGFNRCMYGSGDYRGYEYYNEFLLPIKPRVFFAPSFHIGYGSSNVTQADQPRFKTTSFGIDGMIYVSPWKFQKSKIQIGAGPSLRYFSDGSPNIYTIRPAQLPNSSVVFNNYTFNYETKPNYVRLGYSVVIDGELNVTPVWVIGGRISFSDYSYDVISQYGFSFSRRF